MACCSTRISFSYFRHVITSFGWLKTVSGTLPFVKVCPGPGLKDDVISIIVLIASILFCLVRDSESTTAGKVGFALSNAVMMSQTLNWFVRQTSDVETHIVSVERLSEYSNDRENFPYEKQTDDDDQGYFSFNGSAPEIHIFVQFWQIRGRKRVNLSWKTLVSSTRKITLQH